MYLNDTWVLLQGRSWLKRLYLRSFFRRVAGEDTKAKV